MEFKEVLYSRRSTRAFADKAVTKEQIVELLTAAVNAPNACNMQSWHFYVVTDAEMKEKFRTQNVCANWATTAPVIFVVCTDGKDLIKRFGDRAKNVYIIQDTSAAIENLLLTAADMGLGGCWMGLFDIEKCVKLLDIPEGRVPVAFVPVGVPAVKNIPFNGRKPIDDVVTFVGESVETVTEPAQEKRFKLCGASLPKAVFDDLNLDHATFNNINLHGVKFSDINMSNAFFGGLNLSGSYFGCVDLNDSTFENPCLDGSEFKNCSLNGVKFEGCKMKDIKIKSCDELSIEITKSDGTVININE